MLHVPPFWRFFAGMCQLLRRFCLETRWTDTPKIGMAAAAVDWIKPKQALSPCSREKRIVVSPDPDAVGEQFSYCFE
jgi:hypothetical protein